MKSSLQNQTIFDGTKQSVKSVYWTRTLGYFVIINDRNVRVQRVEFGWRTYGQPGPKLHRATTPAKPVTPTQPTHARSPFRVDIVEQHYYPTFGPEEYYSTFVHEFGHSAFASAVGSGLQFIYVRPDGNGGTAGGHMRHDGITDRHGRSHRQSQAAMSLSGPVAEYLTFGTLPRTLGGWSGDRRKLVENLGRYKAPSYLGAKAPDFIYTMVAEMQLDRLSGTVNGRPVVIDFDLLAMALYEAYTVVGSRIAKVQRLARRYADRRVSRITGGAVTTIETELSTTDLGGNEVVCR